MAALANALIFPAICKKKTQFSQGAVLCPFCWFVLHRLLHWLTKFVEIAVERWLHMNRRSLTTVRRLVILHITFAAFLVITVTARMYEREMSPTIFTVMRDVHLLVWLSRLFLILAFSESYVDISV